MFVGLFSRAQGQMRGLSSDVAGLHSRSINLEDYLALMSETPHIGVRDCGLDLASPVHSIEFSDVSFCYPGASYPVLKDISFTVASGEQVFLAGRNGAGKSTILKLLLRLYDPTAGSILVNGIDIRKYSVRSLRHAFAVLMQDYTRYLMTVRENVVFGDLDKREGREAVDRCLQTSGFSETLTKLPEGVHTVLGRVFGGSTDLSGGEWQRLALARALYREASVVVLDEPTGALDLQSEIEVLRSLKEQVSGKISFVVSHRLAAASLATRVVFLADGMVVEDGSHGELLRRGGLYAQLYRSQSLERTRLDLLTSA